MNFDQQLEPLLQKYELKSFGPKIKQAIEPAILFCKQTQTEVVPGQKRFFGLIPAKPMEVKRPLPISPGASRVGGVPEVPPEFVWPRWKGRPLSLLAQINCAETAVFDQQGLWPRTGSLCFFYDLQEQPWGSSTDDFGSWAVRYLDTSEQASTAAPHDTQKSVLPCFGLSPKVFPTLPGQDTPAFDALGLGDDFKESFFELSWKLKHDVQGADAMHQSLGFPDNIQGSVEKEWEDFANKTGKRSEGDWKLLLQFDSDNELNVMWGDAGMLYFGIRESDFRARQFENVVMTMQCS